MPPRSLCVGCAAPTTRTSSVRSVSVRLPLSAAIAAPFVSHVGSWWSADRAQPDM